MNTIIYELYVNKKYSLRMVAKEIHKDHHYVKRRLEKMGIAISTHDRAKMPYTDEHRKKISNAWKLRKERGYIPYNLGKKMDRMSILKNMRGHLKYNVSLEWLNSFDDIEKLKILNKAISRKRDYKGFDTEDYKKYIIKFYSDKEFNRLYKEWVKTKDKWIKPSLDHIIPKAKGGSLDVDNLRFISWFENKAKGDIPIDKWNKMKKNINYYL